MAWTQQDYSFKTLLNRRETDSTSKGWSNEYADFTLNVHVNELWLNLPPSTPPSTSGGLQLLAGSSPSIYYYNTSSTCVRKFVNLVLWQDTSVANNQCYFASLDGTNSNRLKNFISEKYNSPTTAVLQGYAVVVYDKNSNQITAGDNSNWLFNYQTGILEFANTSTNFGTLASTGPFSITVYQYVGAFGNQIGAGIGSAVGGGTSESVLYIDASSNLAQDNANFFYDFTNHRLHLDSTGATAGLSLGGDVQITRSGTNTIMVGGNLVVNPNAGGFGLQVASIPTASLPTSAAGNIGAIVWDTTAVSLKVSTGSTWALLATTTGGAGAISGSGTANYVPLYVNSTTLTNSIMSQNGTVIQVAGTIRATAKSFDIPHPTKPGFRLMHGCLEGPEHGAYLRGKARGTGRVWVAFPDYWPVLAREDWTISLTPYGNYSLYVDGESHNGFWVAREGQLEDRSKEIVFSYLVIGARTDAPLEIERREDNTMLTPPPYES